MFLLSIPEGDQKFWCWSAVEQYTREENLSYDTRVSSTHKDTKPSWVGGNVLKTHTSANMENEAVDANVN